MVCSQVHLGATTEACKILDQLSGVLRGYRRTWDALPVTLKLLRATAYFAVGRVRLSRHLEDREADEQKEVLDWEQLSPWLVNEASLHDWQTIDAIMLFLDVCPRYCVHIDACCDLFCRLISSGRYTKHHTALYRILAQRLPENDHMQLSSVGAIAATENDVKNSISALAIAVKAFVAYLHREKMLTSSVFDSDDVSILKVR